MRSVGFVDPGVCACLHVHVFNVFETLFKGRRAEILRSVFFVNVS